MKFREDSWFELNSGTKPWQVEPCDVPSAHAPQLWASCWSDAPRHQDREVNMANTPTGQLLVGGIRNPLQFNTMTKPEGNQPLSCPLVSAQDILHKLPRIIPAFRGDVTGSMEHKQKALK